MDLRLMALNIQKLCPDLSIPVIKQRINVRYKQVLNAEDWEFLNNSTTVSLIGIHENTSSESVSISNGSASATGSGTSFDTDAITGYFFRFGSENQPYIVSSVTSDTELTLETNYGGGDNLSGEDFSYYKTIYSPSVGDVAEIQSIVYTKPLIETSASKLNALDPKRTATGEPRRYRIESKTKASGITSFEIWPIPDDEHVVTVNYKKLASALTNDIDEPVFDSEILEAGSLWDCYRVAFAITKNTAYIGLARDARMDFKDLLHDLVIRDNRTASTRSTVRDVMHAVDYDDNFAMSHDVDAL